MYIRRAADLGALIRDRRKAAGMTQSDFAAKIGTSQRWVSEIERGKPTAELEMALRAVNALGLSLAICVSAMGKRTQGKSGRSRPRINTNDLVDD